jgi:hypothetical protein
VNSIAKTATVFWPNGVLKNQIAEKEMTQTATKIAPIFIGEFCIALDP